MKTLIALAAASFITTGAVAAEMQYPVRANYTAVVPSADHQHGPDDPEGDASFSCELTFIPNGDTHETGTVGIQCSENFITEKSWSAAGGFFELMGGEGVQNVEFGMCDEWPSIAVGETVSNPCWMTSTLDTPVRVTRDN